MFDSLLIANRGEIACRIVATCRRLGIRTVAVYSDADRDARHVRMADEAVRLGPPPAAESYLVVERVLDAARRTGAAAVHPGYGFLSESSAFARAVRDAGLIFVGPPPEAMERLGGKDSAKALLAPAGVPLVPGYHGADQADARLRDEANGIGFPLLIKATAGGGGKGMRRVDHAAEFLEALAACRREAKAAFGDDRVLLERLIDRPRHVELQVFADRHGQAVHLFERDCTLQRRHQKIIEEAPAPGPRPGDARGARAGRHRRRTGRRLRERRHGRVPARPVGRLLLHRDEHAAAGRAPGDRGDHRPGPGRVAAAHRRRRAAAAAAGGDRLPGPRLRGAALRRGPGRAASCPRSGGCAPCGCPRAWTACASTPASRRAMRSRPTTTR